MENKLVLFYFRASVFIGAVQLLQLLVMCPNPFCLGLGIVWGAVALVAGRVMFRRKEQLTHLNNIAALSATSYVLFWLLALIFPLFAILYVPYMGLFVALNLWLDKRFRQIRAVH